jgi:hypothetical protein
VNKQPLLSVFFTAILIGGLVLASAMHFGTVHAFTNVGGTISSNTTWTKANSPYNLLGPTLVSSGVTLTIDAGATVNLNTYYLQIDGTLRAIGTSTDPVYINSSAVNAGQIKFTASSTSWNEQSGSGCIIENAVINQTVISTTNCSVKISSNTFNDNADMMHENVAVATSGIGSSTISNNNFVASGLEISDSSTVSNNVIQGGIGLDAGSPLVSKNTISGGSSYFWIGRSFDRDYDTLVIYCSAHVSGNTIDGDTIISCYESISPVIDGNTMLGLIGDGEYVGGSTTFDVDLSNNKIAGGIAFDVANLTVNHNLIVNTDTGVQIGNGELTDNTIAYCTTGVQVNSGCSPTVHGNNIVNCSQHSLQLTGSGNVYATNNWWGTTDMQAINQSIYDFKYDFNLGTVNFVPFLTKQNPEAPEISYVPTTTPLPTSTPSQSPSPTATSSPATTSPTPTSSQEPSQMEQIEPILGAAIVVAVIIVAVGASLLFYFKKRKR